MAADFEVCECYAEGKQIYIVPCGCGDPECTVRTYRDEDVIHFRNGHWHAICALRVALQECGHVKELLDDLHGYLDPHPPHQPDPQAALDRLEEYFINLAPASGSTEGQED